MSIEDARKAFEAFWDRDRGELHPAAEDWLGNDPTDPYEGYLGDEIDYAWKVFKAGYTAASPVKAQLEDW